MKELAEGQTLMVYEDPYTRTKEEGNATIKGSIELIGECREGRYYRCDVRFLEDEHDECYSRVIFIKNETASAITD